MANFFTPTEDDRAQWASYLSGVPESVSDALKKHDIQPWRLYRLQGCGGITHRVVLISTIEPGVKAPCGCGQDNCVGAEIHDEPTATVLISGRFNLVGFERRVGPVRLDALTECDLPKIGEPVGSAGIDPDKLSGLSKEEMFKHAEQHGGFSDPDRFTRFGQESAETN